MFCPNCNTTNNKVKDSRETTQGTVRRRRTCLDCGHVFTTYESTINPNMMNKTLTVVESNIQKTLKVVSTAKGSLIKNER